MTSNADTPDAENSAAQKVSFYKRKTASIAKQLKDMLANLENESLNSLDSEVLTLMLDLVERLHSKFDSVQSSLEEEDFNEIESNARSNFESIYITTKAAFIKELGTRRATENCQSTQCQFSMHEPHQSIIIAQHKARLPTLQIPKFSGLYKDWPDFFSMFTTMVDNDSDLTKIEKFQHLRSNLKDAALDTIRSLEISDNNYDRAIEMLKSRFDNKRLIFQAHIREIFGLASVESGSVARLRELSDKVNSHLRALQSMGSKEQLSDCLLIHLIGRKLDVTSQAKWEETTPINEIPTWNQMTKFLERRCQMLENVESAMVSEAPGKQASKNPITSNSIIRKSFIASSSHLGCFLCESEEHFIPSCSKFLCLTPELRYKEVKRLNLCLNCLKRGHSVKVCRSGSCRHCSSKHNSLLHMTQASSSQSVPTLQDSLAAIVYTTAASDQATQTASVSSLHTSLLVDSPKPIPEDFVFLATALIFVKNIAGSLIPCRALLDSGSQVHFVTNRLINQLQVRKIKSRSIISGIGETDLVSDHTIDLHIESRFGDYSTTLTAIVTPSITENQPQCSLDNVNWSIPSNLHLADPLFYKTNRIDVLIGAGLFFELLSVGQVRLGANLPLLQKTRLGWVVSGGHGHSTNKHLSFAALEKSSTQDPDYHLDNIVRKFWEIENCTESAAKFSKEELACEHHFVENYRRLQSGEISVRLPFAVCPSKLGESYQQALARFQNLERKLQRSSELKLQYCLFMKEYQYLNHMSLVKSLPKNIPSYFLPHHCVLKADSTTTKLRVVFDGSACTTSGYSLNDVLMVGPTIQPKLFDLLLRFRSFKIALTGDIAKMYRCVRVPEPDSFLQCILWRDSPDRDVQIFRLDTVTYGTKSAAFLSIRAMHQLATDEEADFPIASKIVRRDFYVDDLISGGDSVDEVFEILKQTRQLLGRGKFELRKWCSNDVSVLSEIEPSDREKFLKFHDGSDVTKTLGLVWDPSTDSFIFSFIPFAPTNKITKRSILSIIARFYDPLGLIGPVIAKAKIFMQILWKEKINWDESLPQALQTHWQTICAELELVSKYTFPRCVMVPDATLEIHAFCDASLAAYGACLYIRAQTRDMVKVSLLCSKSRVAPLKSISIPKLELCGAALLANLVDTIVSMGIFKGAIHCWSDSTTVLSWIKDHCSNFNVFVANRISIIQTLTSNMTWHYVPSELNPADILSKGATPTELLSSHLWQNGPAFLKYEPGQWPAHPVLVQDLPERRKLAFTVALKTIDLSINCKFVNSFGKMQRIFAYIARMFRQKSFKIFSHLTAEEVQQGTQLLIRMVQKSNLSSEYNALRSKRQIDSSSKIFNLNPFIDDHGLLRVGGRLHNALLDFESRHPLILPRQHPLTNSLIIYFHEKWLHSGPQALLASIRLQFWPIGGIKAVSRVINKCIQCFRTRPKLAEHIMGTLPADRVQANRAFLVTGIDFFGPFLYQSEIRTRAPIKCYICLFICFSTKAVHLELVKDLSTQAFLAALKRFICTRGKPKTIWSDNATNFVGAKNELAELKQLFLQSEHQEAVQQFCLEDSIDWQFIPPRSPHFGGLWEASVKTAKYHFWRTAKLSILNFDELRTLVCQISAIMNSRPLCPLTENPDDLAVLTPAHFLIGAPFTSIVEPDVSMLNIHRLGRWQKLSQMQQIFWKKWSTEYLTLLQQRNKWRTSTSNIAVGAMALLKDENLPPLKWTLARVTEIIKGDDGVARVVVLRTSSGTTKRAVAKICILPIDEDTVESLNLSTGGGC